MDSIEHFNPPPYIRRVTEADTAWLHALGAHAYPDGTYDRDAAEQWITSLMKSQNHLLLRGDRAWVAAWVQSAPYRPQYKTGHFMVVASFGGATRELREMTDAAVKWAREREASRMYWSNIADIDFGPIAKPLGAVRCSPAYMLEL